MAAIDLQVNPGPTMNNPLHDAATVALVGIGATATMDLGAWLLSRLGVPAPNFALVGRWVGHGLRGRWVHEAIARSTPLRHERTLGWLAHYAVGIAFAAALVAICGSAWVRHPSLLPALGFGIATVAAPLFVMQPAMGAGIASSRTATPLRNGLRSLTNHALFGAGLYLSAVVVEPVLR